MLMNFEYNNLPVSVHKLCAISYMIVQTTSAIEQLRFLIVKHVVDQCRVMGPVQRVSFVGQVSLVGEGVE